MVRLIAPFHPAPTIYTKHFPNREALVQPVKATAATFTKQENHRRPKKNHFRKII